MASQSKDQHSPDSVNVGADYTADEVEFLKAMEKFKKDTNCKFPRVTDYLRVLIQLGYRKVTNINQLSGTG